MVIANLSSKIQTWLRYSLRPRRQMAIAEACLIGLISALAAVFFKQSIGWLGTWRVHISRELPPSLVLPTVGLCLGFVSGLLVEQFAPEAAGSGIPQVKAVLAQFPIALNLRVALVKLVSGILALSSGLTLGRQGPTVHIGAAVAAQLSHWVPTSPDHRRQMIAAGAGAGLAAGFNAPIAGILFVVEELLHDVSQLTLGTAIVAAFIGGVVSRLLGGRNFNLNLELTTYKASFFAQEIPFYLMLGILAGILGALFCKGIFVSLNLYRKSKLSLPWRVGLAGFISGTVVAFLPDSFRDSTGLREFVITGDAGWQSSAIAFVAHFILTLIACGSGAPGGLFAPSLILGSALGYLVGILQYHLLGITLPTTYALAGMGAFFSAVAKVPITAIVIVFEMTADFNLVLPLMIACVSSYLVSEKLDGGSLYNRLLEWNGIHLENTEVATEGLLTKLKAADVMQRRVETLPSNMALEEVIQAFSRSHHRGFPVVENNQIIGIITQTDIANWQQGKQGRQEEGREKSDSLISKIRAGTEALPGQNSKLKTPSTLREIMTPKPVTVNPDASLSHVLYLLNRYQLSRLPVTEGRKLIGIITRADIIRAEADQLEGQPESKGPQPQHSYVVYQTRAPAVGKGRLLVPLANPQTASSLLQLAAAIARDRDYELECICCHSIPRGSSPSETSIRTTRSRRLLRQAEKLGREWNIPVHTQIRITHDISQAILEIIKERHITSLLMGWKGSTTTPGRIFGSVVDTLIRQAPCDVILVKFANEEDSLIENLKLRAGTGALPLQNSKLSFNSWLVPMAGGPNAEEAVKLLPALIAVSHTPQIRLCQVFSPSCQVLETPVLDRAVSHLRQRLGKYKGNEQSQKHCRFVPVIGTHIRGNSVSEAVIRLTETDRYDVVVLGASREGLLQQAVKGNIPEAIARGVKSTVILVRSAGEIS